MTHTISAPGISDPAADPAPVGSITPVRPPSPLLLGAGAVAGPLFLGAGIIQGIVRDGFDFTHNAISQLSLGDPGWIQIVNFLVTGVLIIAGAFGVRQATRGTKTGVWACGLIIVVGASFLVSGVFRADPGNGFPSGTPKGATASISTHGAVHLVGGMVGYLALCAAFLVLARHFAAQGRRRWTITCRVVPVGVIAGFAASAATVLAFTTGAALGLLALTAVAIRLRTATPTRH
jgi:hypothetical protein